MIESKDIKNESSKYLLKFLFSYLKDYKARIANGALLMFLVSIIALPSPYIMKHIIDDILPIKSVKMLNFMIIILVTIYLARMMLSYFTNFHFSKLNQDINAQVKKSLYFRILRLPYTFFTENPSGYLVSRIKEVDKTNILFSNTIIRFLIGIIEFIFSLLILFKLEWRLTIIAIFFLPIFYVATRFHTQHYRKYSSQIMEKSALVSKQFQETLSGFEIVKLFNAEERESQKIGNLIDNLKNSIIKFNIHTNFSQELLRIVSTLGGTVILWFSGWQIINSNFSIGGYFAFSGYLYRLFGPTQTLATINLNIQPAFIALKRITNFFQIPTEEKINKDKININSIKTIEFKDVSFFHGDKQILDKINLKINKGDKILIKGPNGSGKSTLVSLLLGFYHSYEGSISINNVNLKKINHYSIRARISLASQNDFLFDNSIRNNIFYNRSNISNIDFLRSIHSFRFINLDSIYQEKKDISIGESGKKLSGGEKKKIIVARTLLKESDVMIFDEVSSNLDSSSIDNIEKYINNNLKGKINIIISHSKYLKIKPDKIVYLNSGRIEKIV